ncbi:OadG family protein [Brooklawnia sp.]|uniref:OadG family protein n=1 Tax=Brooklawnia sp. TaxID=2699740 RepID=UPI00311E2346
MMLLGMGSVFLMLIVLMAVLMLLGRSTKQPAPAAVEEVSPELEPTSMEPADENLWMTIADDSGLTPEQIAAVSVAVAVHADVRRKQGAPANRVYAPGSRLWASRWVAMGRSSQMTNQRR